MSILSGEESIRSISDPIFVLLCHINNCLGLTYQGLIFILSAILIISAATFLKDCKEVLYYAFPLFFLFSLPAENLIRWFLAFSFLLLSVYHYNQKNIKKTIFFLVLVVGSHMGMLIVALIIIGVTFFKRPIFSWKISVSIYIFLWLFFSTDYMVELAKYTNHFSFIASDYYAGYIENAEIWLSGTGMGDKAQNFGLGLAIPDILTIYLAYKVVYKRPQLTFYTNIYLIGVLLSAALLRLEIGYRISIVLTLFQSVVLAYAFKDYLFSKRHCDTLNKIFCWILVLNLVRSYFVLVFTEMEVNQLLYIWDSNGRVVL